MKKYYNHALNIIFLSIILVQTLFFSSVYAHKVNNYAYREGDKIFGECYFVDGSPCKNSRIEVYNLRGQKILETATDDKGKYSFVFSGRETLRIIAYAGEGHRAEYRLEEVKTQPEGRQNNVRNKAQTFTSFKNFSNEEQIKQVIDNSVNPKLQELQNEIREMRKQIDRVNIRDIIGGIGYILGIWGIIMLLRNKKNAS